MTVPHPPHPCAPAIETLQTGSALYRVHGNSRGPTEFNDSGLGSTRFAFFADRHSGVTVPVLYGAETETASIAESLLHDIPVTGGTLPAGVYRSRVMNRIVSVRPFRLARFHGMGLRRLRVDAAQLTDTDRSEYARTVRWAEAAHGYSDLDGGLDGIAWMSRHCNSERAYVFFGNRVASNDFDIDPRFGRVFADVAGVGWLSDLCAPLGVDVVH